MFFRDAYREYASKTLTVLLLGCAFVVACIALSNAPNAFKAATLAYVTLP